MRGSSTIIPLFVFWTAAAARADDDDNRPSFELAGDRLIVHVGDVESNVPLGCVPRSFTSLGPKAYALCPPSTIVIVDATPSPHVAERRPLRERIVSLSVVDGVVSARSGSGLHPLDDYAVASAPPVVSVRPLTLRGPHYESAPPTLVAQPEIRGLEIDLLGTLVPGVDSPAGIGVLLAGAFIYRVPTVPFAIAAYGVTGAATGAFDPGSRVGGPNGGDVQVATGDVIASIDSRYVSFGIGAGVGLMDHGYEVEPLVVLRGRAGEIDHLEFRWHLAFATGGATPAGEFGGILEFQVAPRWWFGADAELGNLRYGRFMLDVRRRLSGDGYHGTLDLLAGLGLAYVHTTSALVTSTFESNCQDQGSGGDITCTGTNTDYLGPALSIGLLWRP